MRLIVPLDSPKGSLISGLTFMASNFFCFGRFFYNLVSIGEFHPNFSRLVRECRSSVNSRIWLRRTPFCYESVANESSLSSLRSAGFVARQRNLPQDNCARLWATEKLTQKSSFPACRRIRLIRVIHGFFHYAFQTFPAAIWMPAIAFRVSTKHRAHSPSSW